MLKWKGAHCLKKEAYDAQNKDKIDENNVPMAKCRRPCGSKANFDRQMLAMSW